MKSVAQRPVAVEVMLRECEVTGCPGFLLIGEKYYEYQSVDVQHAPEIRACVNLRDYKATDAEPYTVTQMQDGRLDCDCAWAVYKTPTTGTLCRHCAAMLKTGIFVEPSPVMEISDNVPF